MGALCVLNLSDFLVILSQPLSALVFVSYNIHEHYPVHRCRHVRKAIQVYDTTATFVGLCYFADY